MPVFQTPEPISVTLDLAVGDVRIDADHRGDTVVEVRPSDSRNEADAKAAEDTRVEYAAGKLVVRGPKARSVFGRAGSIDVMIDVPTGSGIAAAAEVAAIRCHGRLGECQLKTSSGDIELEETGPLTATTSIGDVTVTRVVGRAEVTTGSGVVRVAEVDGPLQVKNSNGENWVGEVSGDLRVRVSNGAVTVDKAHAAVEVRTANGDIRIGEVVRGEVVLGTSSGQLDIGIRSGTAALLDVRTKVGNVYNFMAETPGPGTADETVRVYANTARGDIAIRRV